MRKFSVCLLLVAVSAVSASASGGFNGSGTAGQPPPADDSVFLSFDGLPEGASAARVLAAWGVSFQGLGSEPRVRLREIFAPPVPQGPTPVLRNEGVAGQSSADRPLLITLARPAREITVVLANGSETTRAEVFALDSLGREVARVSGVSVETGEFGIGIPVDLAGQAGETIRTVVVDYGSDIRAEEVDSLSVVFSEPPRFQRCLAQVGDGVLPGGAGSLRTVMVLTNSHTRARIVRLSFRDRQGNPLEFPTDRTAGAGAEFELGPQNSLVLVSPGTSNPPVEGYACVESGAPVGAFALYQFLDPAGEVRFEAGIDARQQQTIHLLPAQRSIAERLDTGIAVVNLSDSVATVWYALTAGNGTDNRGGGMLELQPGEHRAVFLEELYDSTLEVQDGTLVVNSTQPLAITGLQTRSGLPVSSLPSVSRLDPLQYVP